MTESQSLWSRLYTPQTVFNPKTQKYEKKYGSGRYTKNQWILLHFVLVFLVFIVMTVLILYFMVIPALIKSKVDSIDISTALVSRLDLVSFDSDALEFGLEASLGSLLFLPITATVGASSMIVKDEKSRVIANLQYPEFKLALNDVKLDWNAKLSTQNVDNDAVLELLQEFSSETGLEPRKMTAESVVSVKCFGITWYKDLQIVKNIETAHLSSNMYKLMNYAPNMIKSKDFPAPNQLGEIEISSILPNFTINSLKFIDSDDLSIQIELSFVNPTVIGLDAKRIEFNIMIDNTLMTRVKLTDFNLKRDLTRINTKLEMTFDSPEFRNQPIFEIIDKMSKDLIQGNEHNHSISIGGPIVIDQTRIIPIVSKPLRLHIFVNDIIKKQTISEFRTKFTDFKKLLKSSSLDLNMKNEAINAGFDISLAGLLNLPDFKFPFKVDCVLMDESAIPALSITNNPMYINVKSSETKFAGGISIVPLNNLDAANSLGNIVNPFLATKSLNAKMGSVKVYSDKGVKKWSKDLFEKVLVSISLPSFLSIDDLVDQFMQSNPPGIQSASVRQIRDYFLINAQMKLQIPLKVAVSVGYLGIRANIGQEPIIKMEMNQGLNIKSGLIPIDASVIPQRFRNVAAVQSVVDSLVSDANPDSFSVSGLEIGSSNLKKIITFSKIRIPLKIKKIAARMQLDDFTIDREPLVKVSSASILHSNDIMYASMETRLNNPTPFSADLGHLNLNLLLDDSRLGSFKLSPVSISREINAPFNVDMQCSLDHETLSDQLADFISHMNRHSLKVHGLVIGEIDHFKDLKIPLSFTSVPKTLMNSNLIDVSAFKPSVEMLQKLGNLEVKVKDQNRISIAIDVDYLNHLPLDVKIDSVAFKFLASKVLLMSMDIQGLEIKRGASRLQITMELEANLMEAAAISLETAVHNIFAGKRPDLSVTGIRLDSNSLFNSIELPIGFMAALDFRIDVKPVIERLFNLRLPLEIKTLLVDLLDSLSSIDVSAKENHSLTIGTELGMNLPVKIEIPSISCRLDVKNRYFATVSLKDFSISNSRAKLQLNLRFSDSLTGNEIGQLIESTRNAHISELILGSIGLFKRLGFSLNFNLFKFNQGLLDDELIVRLSSIMQKIAIKMAKVQLNEVNRVNMAAKALVSELPFKLSVDIPFVSLDSILISNVELVSDLQLNGLRISDSFDTSISLKFEENNQIKSALKRVFDAYLNEESVPDSLRINGIRIGTSDHDSVNIINFSTLIDPICNLAFKIGKSYLKEFASGIPKDLISYLNSSNMTDVVHVPLGLNSSIDIGHLQVEFDHESNLLVDLKIGINLPLEIELLLPIVNFELALNSELFASCQVENVKIVSGQVARMHLLMKFTNSNRMKYILKQVTEDLLSNNIQKQTLTVSGIQFGYSRPVDTFSTVTFSLPMAALSDYLIIPHVHIDNALKLLHPKIKDLELHTASDGTLKPKFEFSTGFPIPVSIKLGFFKFNISLSDSQIAQISIGNLSLSTGNNTIRLEPTLRLFNSQGAKEKLGKLVTEIITVGFGKTTGYFSVDGIEFGQNEQTAISVFSFAKVSVDTFDILEYKYIKSILMDLGVDLEKISLEKFIQNLQIDQFDFGFDHENDIQVQFKSLLKHFHLQLHTNIHYFKAHVILNGKKFVSMIANDFLLVGNGDFVEFDTRAELEFESRNDIDTELAKIVDKFIRNETDFTVELTGLEFGKDADRAFTLLSDINVKLPLENMIKLFRKEAQLLLDGIANSTVAIPLQNKNVLVGIPKENTLRMELDAILTMDLFKNLNINVPFASIMVKIDNSNLIKVNCQDLLVKNAKVSAVLEMEFTENDRAAQRIITLGTNWVWRRPMGLLPAINIANAEFGSLSVFSKVNLPIDLKLFYDSIQKALFNSPSESILELLDINAQVTPRGVEAKILCKRLPDWLPVTAEIGGISAFVLYNMNDSTSLQVTNVVGRAIFSNFTVKPGHDFTMDLTIETLDDDQFTEAASHAVVRLLSFEDYAAFALLGRLNIVSGDPFTSSEWGNSITVFKDSTFEAPDLYFWRPIKLNPIWHNPFSKQGFTFSLQLKFPNSGPLHIDVGILEADLSKIGNSSSLVKVTSEKSLTVKNGREGGADLSLANPENGILKITIPWNDVLNPIKFFMHLQNLLKPASDDKISIRVIHPIHGQIVWLKRILDEIPFEVARNLFSIIIGMMQNVDLGLFDTDEKLDLMPEDLNFMLASQDFIHDDS